MISSDVKQRLERLLLVNIMFAPKAIQTRWIESVSKDYFSSSTRLKIFNVMKGLSANGSELSPEHIVKKSNDRSNTILEMKSIMLMDGKGGFEFAVKELEKDHMHTIVWRMGQKLQEMSTSDESIDKIKQYIDQQREQIDNSSYSVDGNSMQEVIEKIEQGEFKSTDIVTKDWQIDTHVKLSTRNVLLIAGKGGSFKTKFVIYLIRRILHYNENIAVKWYAMEDPADKMIRNLVAQQFLMSTVTLEDNEILRKYSEKLKKFDVEFVNKSSSIQEVGKEFKRFVQRKKGKIKILVIDNIMKLKKTSKSENRTFLDEVITEEVDSWNVKTSNDDVLVLWLHHLNVEPFKNSNEDTGYRPKPEDVKGSSRYIDTSTQVMLVNAFKNFPDIQSKYESIKHVIEHLFIIDLVKNRNNKEATLRYFAFPAINWFISLEKESP